jgi:hypothetical protein
VFKWFSSLFGAPAPKPAPIVVETPLDMPLAQWREDCAFPIPRGQAFRSELQAKNVTPQQPYWRALFQQWFTTLGPILQAHSEYAPNGFRWVWHKDFILLSPLDQRRTEVLARYCERSARHICRVIPGLAQMSKDGALPIIVFPDADTYGHYTAHFFADDEAGIASAGMFVLAQDDDSPALPRTTPSDIAGFGHFILLADEIDRAEPTLVHEMTHALLSHLDLPLWINEGIATAVERGIALAPADPAFVINRQQDLLRRHRQYWTESTKPSFWDGSAFQSGHSSELAYDMAYRIVFELARDMPAFTAFAKAADPIDGGAQAAESIYGLAIDVLLDGHLAIAN